MTFLRTPASSGQVLLTRRNFQKRKSRLGFTDCPSSSEKSPVVAPEKITIAFARLFLLRSTTNFFRQCVPLFVRNANARNLCLREAGGFGLLFLCFCLNRISGLMPPRRTKRRSYAFRLTAKRLLCGVAAPLPPKGTTSGQVLLTRRNFQKRKSRLGFTDCPSTSQ